MDGSTGPVNREQESKPSFPESLKEQAVSVEYVDQAGDEDHHPRLIRNTVRSYLLRPKRRYIPRPDHDNI